VQAFFSEPAQGNVKVALASGEAFPDAIVAAAAYSSKGAPVILGKCGDQLLDSFEEVNKRSDDWGTGVVHVGNSMDFHAGLPNRVLRPVP